MNVRGFQKVPQNLVAYNGLHYLKQQKGVNCLMYLEVTNTLFLTL